MHNKKNGKERKRRFVTLIEMMIVMFLIALITGVVAYNYTGSLEKGKVFKTQTGIEKLTGVLSLAKAENPSLDLNNWQDIVRDSPLVQDPNPLLQDGWGEPYNVNYDNTTGRISVTSTGLNAYHSRNSRH